ncbi:MAG: asparagine synthase (glutamine-hydrolyzing) [Frankiaceae bacterium]|nr:asparagine synthase (glutamine-hydrolyzing) [Frankiaceae bacterium]
MCGIAGGTGADSAARRAAVSAQLAQLRRRGPDAEGFIPGRLGAVGQTRLSVIDVERGDPPLTDESGQVRVALNGEIYNYRALMKGLRERGHTFRSACDTEVLAHLAEEDSGATLAARLDGMFAFAIWDERTATLTLGRDRLGKKPLYYWYGDGELVFGSEIKAVLADHRVPRRVRTDVIPSYLYHGYVPGPDTFFEGVLALPPGCVLTMTVGAAPQLTRYWDVPLPGPDDWLRETGETLAEHLREQLRTAVSKRLVADVPLGAFLSGGVDSSLVVALMAEQLAEPVRTFSIGFESPRYDERHWAQLVSRRYGTKHVEHVVHADAGVLLTEVLDACDQPVADSAALPTWLLAKMTREHVTVALSGDGGDELFAGYERFAAGSLLGRLGPAASLLAPVTSRLARARSLPERSRRALSAASAGLPGGYERLVAVFSPEQVAALVPAASSVERAHDDVWAASAGTPTLTRLLHLNVKTYLPEALLVKADRMSMRHGLEVRSPLLDTELLSFALRIPPDQQMRGTSLKRALKAAARGLVPDEVLERPKRGFGVPLDEWFRGTLAATARATLAGPGSALRGHLEPNAVQSLLSEHASGARDHGERLWSLLLLEGFLRREAA